MENGFASPRADAFPAGLRVLVVDDDPTWLKILEKMLKKCSYEVTTCCLARDALDMLRGRKDGFDIVISDVNMPDMDGFKLLEHVGLEMDLPVIMMSVDGETSRVMKGVQHGACDYLLKPVRMKELRNIWQHVFRKKIHEVRDIESHESNERNGPDEFDDGQLLSGGDLSSAKKRKDMESKEDDDQDFNDPSALKKARVVWSVDLHQKFVNAVNQIGFDKAGPKKILDLMNVPWLTRENVASHLQKYRMYLSRLQKQNEPNACFGVIKQADFTSKDPSVIFGLQSSIAMHQKNAANSKLGPFGNKLLFQDPGQEINEGDLKGFISFFQATEPQKILATDGPDSQKANNGSRASPTHSFGSLRSDINYTSFESTAPPQQSWNGEISLMQFMQQLKQEREPYLLLDGYVHPPLPGLQHHIKATQQTAPSMNPGSSITDKADPSEIKPLHTEYSSNDVRNVPPMGCTVEVFSLEGETDIVNPGDFRDMPIITGPSSMINDSINQKSISNWESPQQNVVPVSESDLMSFQDDLQVCLLQGHGCTENVGLNNIEFLEFDNPELITELPSYLYEVPRLSCDYLCDSMEYPIMDQGLFIA